MFQKPFNRLRQISLALAMSVLVALPALAETSRANIGLDAPSQMGLSMLKALNDGKESVFISPLSIHSCLELAYVGAAGKTEANMAKVMKIDGQSAQTVAKQYSGLLHDMSVIPSSTEFDGPGKSLKMEIANSIWANQNTKLLPSYTSLLTLSFQAVARTVDFARPASVVLINNWVRQATHNKIPTIVKSLDPSTLLMLINTAYFKAHWEKEFDKELTKPGNFYLLGGSTAQVQMMHKESSFTYYEDKDLQAIKLPYTDRRFAMYIFLPRGGSDINKFCDSLSAATWNQWASKMSKRPGSLTMPKFTINYEVKLKQLLSQMGMTDAFLPSAANFSKMVTPPPMPFIGDVIHKTFVDVDEEGTEAAAVTAITMMGASAPGAPVSPFVMTVDHPFCFAVTFNDNTILFLGTNLNPSSGGK